MSYPTLTGQLRLAKSANWCKQTDPDLWHEHLKVMAIAANKVVGVTQSFEKVFKRMKRVIGRDDTNLVLAMVARRRLEL